jgi:poly-gamma-glutamate synthesis protein (capsule biosynthesis protein)
MRSAYAFLLAAACAAMLTLGCSSSGDPMPSTVLFYAEPGFIDPSQSIAGEAFEPLGVSAELAADAASANIIISSAGNGERSFIADYWVLAVQLPSEVSAITMDELRAAIEGQSTAWDDVFVPAGSEPPLDQWWPDLTAEVREQPLDRIGPALAGDEAAFALVPLGDVNASMRSLDVDGVNIIYGTGDVGAYPLVERRWVTTRGNDNDEFDSALEAAGNALVTRLAVAPPDPIIMRATGDIIPARCALARIEAIGDHKSPYVELAPWLREADVTVGSLDTSMADISPPWPCQETFNLAAPSAAIEGLTFAGFDMLTNATNHALDCGQIGSCGGEAMLATNENLRAVGIETAGSGADLAAARAAKLMDVGGVTFAFLAYDEIAPHYWAAEGVPGIAPMNEAYVWEDVASAAALADVVVVMPNWGIEYQTEPTETQRAIAAAAVEAGADVILGNHGHWVQAMELIGDAFVAYALGNFVFDQDWSLETQQGAMLELAFHPDGQGGAALRGARYYPIHIWDEHQPRFADEDEARQIMRRVWDASAALD